MTTLTIPQFHEALKAQGVHEKADLVFRCPLCGTLQSARDLIAAGAGADFDAVEKYLGFSCFGRWTHQLPPPKKKGTQVGCNWTLGGFFQLHDVEVVDEQGKHRPIFAPATLAEATEYHRHRAA